MILSRNWYRAPDMQVFEMQLPSSIELWFLLLYQMNRFFYAVARPVMILCSRSCCLCCTVSRLAWGRFAIS